MGETFGLKALIEHWRKPWLFSERRQGLPMGRGAALLLIYTTGWYVLWEGISMGPRLFKTRNFADTASKAWICDSELREAFGELLKGQGDNLGGGVWKKRLKENRHRSIVLAKGRNYWVYQSLFDKQRQSNINPKELNGLRRLAKVYENLSETQVRFLLETREIVEINHDQKI